jgi:hypothetical protein
MPITVDAEIDVGGNVRLLEPVNITKTTKATVTLLDEPNDKKGNAENMLAFLQSPDFKNRKSYSLEEAEAQIQEASAAWE